MKNLTHALLAVSLYIVVKKIVHTFDLFFGLIFFVCPGSSQSMLSTKYYNRNHLCSKGFRLLSINELIARLITCMWIRTELMHLLFKHLTQFTYCSLPLIVWKRILQLCCIYCPMAVCLLRYNNLADTLLTVHLCGLVWGADNCCQSLHHWYILRPVSCSRACLMMLVMNTLRCSTTYYYCISFLVVGGKLTFGAAMVCNLWCFCGTWLFLSFINVCKTFRTS